MDHKFFYPEKGEVDDFSTTLFVSFDETAGMFMCGGPCGEIFLTTEPGLDGPITMHILDGHDVICDGCIEDGTSLYREPWNDFEVYTH